MKLCAHVSYTLTNDVLILHRDDENHRRLLSRYDDASAAQVKPLVNNLNNCKIQTFRL